MNVDDNVKPLDTAQDLVCDYNKEEIEDATNFMYSFYAKVKEQTK